MSDHLAYIYQADIWCESCGESIRDHIRAAGNAPEEPDDESSYDSDEYPKGPFDDGGGESDSPGHCGAGAECLNGLRLNDGRVIGQPLENPLTSDGVDYVREAIADGGLVAELWAELYADELAEGVAA